MRLAGLATRGVDPSVRFVGLGKRGVDASAMKYAGLGKRNNIDAGMCHTEIPKIANVRTIGAKRNICLTFL